MADNAEQSNDALGMGGTGGEGVFAYSELTPPADIPRELLPNLVVMIRSGDVRQQLHGAVLLRKLLQQTTPIDDDVVASGVCPILVQFLSRTATPQLQSEAARALTIVASGVPEHLTYVVNLNAVPQYVRLLSSPDDNCKAQAVRTIDLLSRESTDLRDCLLSLDVVEPLLRILSTPNGVSELRRDAAFALSALCRVDGVPPNWECLAPSIPTLGALLYDADDEIVAAAAAVLAVLSLRANVERLNQLLAHLPVRRVLQLLTSDSKALQSSALDIVANIVCGNDRHTQVVIDSGALNCLAPLLTHQKMAVQKKTCRILSNITSGSDSQIQAVIDAGLLPPVLDRLARGGKDVKREALWIICNLTCGANTNQVAYLVGLGGLDSLCEFLVHPDAKLVALALEAIENILEFAETGTSLDSTQNRCAEGNPYVALLFKNGGFLRLEALQTSSDQSVFSRASGMLQRYFDASAD